MAEDDDNNDATDEKIFSNCHAESMMGKMEAYFAQKKLCDVMLVSGQVRIPAHRIVLCAASDYFAAMFNSGLSETKVDEVVLVDVDAESLGTLITYVYTGKLEIKEETVENLLSTACLLQFDKVAQDCSAFLIKRLHPSNCIGIRHFSEARSCRELFAEADRFVLENFVDVVNNQEFLMLPSDELEKLLSQDNLNVPSEETILRSLVSWARHNEDKRQQSLSRLLSNVRLPLLSSQFLVDHVQNNELFRNDLSCQHLIMEAMVYHLLPERRLSMQSASTKPRSSTVGVLYAVGGMDSAKGAVSMEKYDLRLNGWSQTDNMNGRRLQFGIAVVDDNLYVVGGRDGLKTLNTVECYDPRKKVWSLLMPMGTHRHGLGVTVLKGPMYAVGGHDGWSYLNTVERWDPQAKQWSYVAPMSTPRSTVGVAVLLNRLYAVGGRDGSSCLRSVESFDPHTNKWVLCSPMSKRRGGVGVASCNGFLYAVGGHDAPASNPASSRFDCVERYDPKTDTWTTVSPISSPRDAVGVCVLGGKLFAVGGYDGQRYLSDVECYDSQSNEWTTVGSLCIGRAGACVVHLQNC